MENMQVVSKLAYNNQVAVVGDTNDNVLVNRKYVTEDLFGVPAWNVENAENYQLGTTVQHNGFFYRCTEDATDTEPGTEDAKWIQISPLLGKRSGIVRVPAETTEVTINHNLDSINLIVQVYKIENSERIPINVSFMLQDSNNILLQFGEPPTNDHHVIIMAFD